MRDGNIAAAKCRIARGLGTTSPAASVGLKSTPQRDDSVASRSRVQIGRDLEIALPPRGLEKMRALRFELRTSSLSGTRSNQLSYARFYPPSLDRALEHEVRHTPA